MEPYRYEKLWIFIFGLIAGTQLFTAVYFLAHGKLVDAGIAAVGCAALCYLDYRLAR